MTELTEQEKWVDEVERFLSEIRRFLAKRFGNGDSWNNIPKEIWIETNDLVYRLLRKKFIPDCDGDSQVEFILIDRSKHRFIYSFPAGKYTHKMETLEEVDREISHAISTLQQASDRLKDLTETRQRLSEKLTLDKKEN